MIILEFRPCWVRLFGNRPSARQNLLTRPVGRLVGAFVRRRVHSRPSVPRAPFLVSVGNLALGGTGKTPVVIDLARTFGRQGVRGAILTRGYGSEMPGPLTITPGTDGAGDEARLMARELAPWQWPVIQSRRRARGLEFLRAQFPATELAFLEDAHQSAGLPRHLDLLILDAWDVVGPSAERRLAPRTGPVFPLGPWREDASGARRAAALLVETSADLPARSIHGQPVFAFSRRQEVRWTGSENTDREKPRTWGLISGIARPEGFEKQAAAVLPGELAAGARCPDHAPYDRDLLCRILAAMDEQGVDAIATTAKDWVKLEPIWEDPRPVVVLDLHLIWRHENALGRWLAERVGLPFSGTGQSGSTAP